MKKYNSKFKTFYFLFVLLTFAFCLLPSTATAAAVDLGISPPIIQIDATPPADVKTPISLQNFTDEEVSLAIYLKPFKSSKENNGQVRYLTNAEFRPADPDIFEKVQILENDHVKDTIVLAPRQQKTIALHVGLPKEEPKTDYYFSVIFVSKDNTAEPGKQSASQTPAGVATNVLLSIGPKGKAKGSISDFSTPFFLESGPVPFRLLIKNTSDHVINPQGQILIRNMFNQTIGRVDLLPVNILADSSRGVPDSLFSPEKKQPDIVQKERSKHKEDMAIWPEKFLIGPYTATLTVALSDEGPLFRRTIYFIALPIQAVVGLSVILLLVAIIAVRIKGKLR